MKKILLKLCLVAILTLPLLGAVVLQEPGMNWMGLSSDTKPTAGVRVGSLFYCTDNGLTWIYNGSTWYIRTAESVGDTIRMTAPGNGTAVATKGWKNATIYYVVSTINTSVTTAMETKAGASQWTAVVLDSTVVTANGNYGYKYDGVDTADSLRFKWISESGGTAAVIIYNIKLSNAER